jgi:hypothetical protein
MDNGAFTGFDPGAFVRMLETFHDIPGCLFVTAPDVVGDAAATSKAWPFWSTVIRGLGHRPAYVLQEGVEELGVPDDATCLFIGGKDKAGAFKSSWPVRALVSYAVARGHWVHAGRVNSKTRADLMEGMGVQSYDGGQFTRFPDLKQPLHQAWEDEREDRRDGLFAEHVAQTKAQLGVFEPDTFVAADGPAPTET